MPILEIKEVYRMLNQEVEVKDFALKHANKFVYWELTHPNLVALMSLFYKLACKFRNILKQ